jgi:predicted PurR-regulated permease PerM
VGRAAAVKRPDSGSGPIVWLVTMVVTTLLLIASTHALWLVVPFLLAIVLYYVMFPLVRRLQLAGFSRETAAAVVCGGVAVVAIAVLIPTVPWLIGQSMSGEEALGRYLEGGRVLIDRTSGMLEKQFGFLQRMDFHAEVGRRMTEFGTTFMGKELPSLLLKAAAQLPALLLVPFLAFFLLRDGGSVMRTLVTSIPNAYFERTIDMLARVHATARNYFQGLIKLAMCDASYVFLGLTVIGLSNKLVLALIAGILPWIPLVGSLMAGAMLILATATQFPNDLTHVAATAGFYLSWKLMDMFVFMPLTVGRSIHMHPLPTVLMLFIGGTVAGVAGLVLALPLAGVVSAIVGTIGAVLENPRLRARNEHAKALEARRTNADLGG